MTDWANAIGWLPLAEVDTPDGTFRFLLGTDGVFRDSNGNEWLGSAMLTVPKLQAAIGGSAPSGEVSLAYFQDPSDPDLIGQVKALGVDYVDGRDIRFFAQPLFNEAELEAPTTAPELFMTRQMTALTFSASGVSDRSITLGFESGFQDRKSARRRVLDQRGHSDLLGYSNPSLEYRPTTNYQDEPLFG